jgi:hypothetical protein
MLTHLPFAYLSNIAGTVVVRTQLNEDLILALICDPAAYRFSLKSLSSEP